MKSNFVWCQPLFVATSGNRSSEMDFKGTLEKGRDMLAEEFVERLREAAPSREILVQYGLDEAEIEDIRATFIAKRRDATEASSSVASCEIEKLFNQFDCSSIQVGLIRFKRSFSRYPKGQCFASCESDSVVVTSDGTINLFEVGSDKPMPCASNASAFLDALATFVEIRSEKGAWKGRVGEAALKCAMAAGGASYREFFEMLCAFIG